MLKKVDIELIEFNGCMSLVVTTNMNKRRFHWVPVNWLFIHIRLWFVVSKANERTYFDNLQGCCSEVIP